MTHGSIWGDKIPFLPLDVGSVLPCIATKIRTADLPKAAPANLLFVGIRSKCLEYSTGEAGLFIAMILRT